MVDEFSRFLGARTLCDTNDHILLGVSGGVDSMVMTDLFLRAGFRVGIAHCNFQLRGKESDGDEAFVKSFAGRHKLPFWSVRFETRGNAVSKGISIQMAARDLRMEWMENLLLQEGYNLVALAHHQDDEVETFFLNLLRGTGISGLGGIRPKTGKIIRPMLFTGRKAILEYAAENNIEYRIDSSNLKTNYARNRVRHNILPELDRIKPGFNKVLIRNMKQIRSLEKILREHVDSEWKRLSKDSGVGIELDLQKLRQLPERESYLFEFLRPYGFNSADATQIDAALDGQPGKKFVSSSHRVIIDRRSLVIKELDKDANTPEEFFISEGTSRIENPISLSFRILARDEAYAIPKDPFVAHMDAALVKFPLKVRRWQKGDRFIPLGMKGHKLLSDYFTDNKLSVIMKENIWILESAGEVIWIIGHRLSDRYKITGRSRSVLEVRHTNP